MTQLAATYKIETTREPTIFVGDEILAQLSDEVRKLSLLPRPSDVRLLMVTAKEDKHLTFGNHGHPDNEQSTVSFDGQNGIMMMLHGDTPAQQLASAYAVIDKLAEKGLERMTSAFVAEEIANPKGSLRSAVAQIYGPVAGKDAIQKQTARFEPSNIIGPDGKTVTVDPVINENYAVGMRAPTNEEVYFLAHVSHVPAYVIGDACHNKLADATKAMLQGTTTTQEKLDGEFVTNGIVLAVDAATGKTKPIRLETAEQIFDLSRMTVLTVNQEGDVVNQYRPFGPGKYPAVKPAAVPA